MNIVLTIDSNFSPQAAACIASVCENNKSAQELSFFILTTGIEEKPASKLHSLVSSYDRTLSIINIGDIYQYFDSDFDTAGWNEIILARLLLDRFLPQNIERALYLDGDTIVRQDLNALWETDLSDCILGAVREPTAGRKRRAALNIPDMRYYNSGVLLINLRSWRNESIGDALLTYCRLHKAELFASDQDAINGTLAGRIKELSPAYNYVNSFQFYPYAALAKMTKPASYIQPNEFARAISNPAIVHYLGEERPWRHGNTHQYRDEYLHYLSLTPFSDTPMEEGWELYFKVWNIFNRLVRPFPMTRHRIITSLIPAFMRFRANKRKQPEKSQ